MQRLKRKHLVPIAAIFAAFFQSVQADDMDLIAHLMQTRAVNMEFIVEQQFPGVESLSGFQSVDPYDPEATETVLSWNENPGRDASVCAVRFIDESRVEYELRTYGSETAAVGAGYAVTHQGRCGTCSALKDLATYLAVPDLTTPARKCARRFGLKGKKRCFQETIGLTPRCAESWAYNAANTRRECLGACISDYGLFNLLFGRYPGPNTDESGQLRPCLQCDEDASGPGFKYSAGRTRRNSGIVSAIGRPDSEIYPVDHAAFFQ